MQQTFQATLSLESPAFSNGSLIPRRYTCDGKNISPPLTIGAQPPGTRSLVLLVDDPDAPLGTWDHWVVWNIEPRARIGEGDVPGTEGLNSFLKHRYMGPCPPGGTHRYSFRIYALDTVLDLPANSKKRAVEKAMAGHVLAQGECTGLYSR
jgi:Raf kinase inhibitor-like YbhB/YbcL family protein